MHENSGHKAKRRVGRTRSTVAGAGVSAVLVIGGILIAGPGPAAATEAGAIPPDIFLVDARSLSEERQELKTVDAARDALARTGIAPLYAPAATRELAWREAALEALEKNLSIRRSRLSKSIAERALGEAEAVFDPVFAASFGSSLRTEFKRVETPDKRFRSGTEAVPVGGVDSKGMFRCTEEADNADGNPADQTCHVITFENRSPVAAVQLRQARAEGFDSSFAVDAHNPSAFQPRHEDTLNGAVSIFQQLPWGPSVNLSVQMRRDEAFFRLNELIGLDDTYGNYQRPYFTTISLGAVLPLPFTKGFGPTAAADQARRLARESIEAADVDIRSVINSTLLEVDTVYWTMVGTLQRLKATLETLEIARKQRASVERLYREELVTESDRNQADGQVAQVQTSLQQIFGEYVSASEAMRALLDSNEQALYLPVGYRAVLRQAPSEIREVERVLNNPTYQRQAVAVRIAGLVSEQREAQTRPDLTLTGSASLAQAGSYGYRTATDSLESIFEPDRISVTAALNYLYPVGNRAVTAAAEGAQHEVTRQRLLLQQAELIVRESYESALATLRSARKRTEISRRTADLAGASYSASARLQEEGFVAVYESLNRLVTLLNARLAFIQAQIDARIAESQLLASVGGLAERSGERMAQTGTDRFRLAMLRATGALKHFGGPL